MQIKHSPPDRTNSTCRKPDCVRYNAMAHHHLSSQKRFVFSLQCEKGMRTRTHSLPFWWLSNGNCVHANGNVSPLSRRGAYPGQKGGKHFIPPHVNDARICHRSSWRGGSFSDAGVARKIQFNARGKTAGCVHTNATRS